MGPDTRRLILLRHAEAESFSLDDRQRRLTSRGVAGAEDVGRWLRQQNLLPDLALVSPAVRTQTTWELIAGGFQPSLGVVFDDRLLNGDLQCSLDALHEITGTADSILYVGHNPVVTQLANLLIVQNDSAEISEVVCGMPPAGVVVAEVTDWDQFCHVASGVGSSGTATAVYVGGFAG
ncbi:MAG TPA: histidine phosphatase family protein [Marmoricola sp.]|nr:histidine phosphatase family protein [Marmoricola sp.]HNN47419.1 histidine phosphatase family protein [Marmoricola sp.]HNO39206.1 histidine phosphatase family protein [Marmoricola sp.]